MGRFDIAKGIPAPDKEPDKPVQKVQGRKISTPQERPLRHRNIYESPPGYPLEDNEIETTSRAGPSRTVVFQWPMGHRTMIPFRSLRMDVTEEGELLIRVPVSEAQRIVNDIEEAHRRFDQNYPRF